MFQTYGSAGYLRSLPPRLDRASRGSISAAPIDARRPHGRPSIVRAGSRLCGCPRPMRRRLAPKKSADPASRTSSPVREAGFVPLQKHRHFFGGVPRAEALGQNREDRPADFAGRSKSVFLLGIPVPPIRASILSRPSNTPSTRGQFKLTRNLGT